MGVLQGHPLADRAQVVAEMERVGGRLDAGEHAWSGHARKSSGCAPHRSGHAAARWPGRCRCRRRSSTGTMSGAPSRIASASADRCRPPGTPARPRPGPGSSPAPGHLPGPQPHRPGHQVGDLGRGRQAAVPASRSRCGCGGPARRPGAGRPRACGVDDLGPQVVVGARQRPAQARVGRDQVQHLAGQRAVAAQQVLDPGHVQAEDRASAVPRVPQRGVAVGARPAGSGRCRTAAPCRPGRAPPRPRRPWPSAGRWCTCRRRPSPGRAPGGRRCARGTAWRSTRTRPASSGRSPAYTPSTSSRVSGTAQHPLTWPSR